MGGLFKFSLVVSLKDGMVDCKMIQHIIYRIRYKLLVGDTNGTVTI